MRDRAPVLTCLARRHDFNSELTLLYTCRSFAAAGSFVTHPLNAGSYVTRPELSSDSVMQKLYIVVSTMSGWALPRHH